MPADNKINIKKVNKDRYDKKRIKCGSSIIYSIEYKCTKKEIKTTTNIIVTDTLSNQKAQLTRNNSIRNQSENKLTIQKE